ncbi:MAG: 16S rRNA (uracil(1498)-N(3))-methyltransferase [Malacoplasma sp.]|nr:16S rRNA (uracil(1498)-N(3))-methyltransferase [Malacoplasma sp.]
MAKLKVSILKDKVIFNQQDAKHLKALRVKLYSQVVCCDENGQYFLVQIDSLNPITGKVIKRLEDKTCPDPYNITCFLGVIKKQYFELAVNQLSQLNILKIVPVYFEYSQKNYQLDLKRIQKICCESKKQCERKQELIIKAPISFNEMVVQLANYDFNFLAYEKQTQSEWDKVAFKNQNSISFMIGPEGGISDKEIKVLQNKCIFLKLTNTILKAETAAIYLASTLIERFYNAK